MTDSNTDSVNTSNLASIDFDKIIEKKIENKFNQVMDILPSPENVNIPKSIPDYTISDIYNGIIQTIIDVINEMSELMSERKYMSNKEYREKIFSIFLNQKRRYFLGIILIILSFILYFIDGSSV